MSDVAANLRAERARARLSQKELALLAGVSQVTIHHIECGHTAPKTSTVISIARALGVPPSKLISELASPAAA